jgi:hypothetical protein
MPKRTDSTRHTQADAARLEALKELCRRELSVRVPSAEAIDKLAQWAREAMHPSEQYLASSLAASELLAAFDRLRKTSADDRLLTEWLEAYGDRAARELARCYPRRSKRATSDRVELVASLGTPPWFEPRELAALYVLGDGQESAPKAGQSASEALYAQTNAMRDMLRRHGKRLREERAQLVRAVMLGRLDPPWLLAELRKLLNEALDVVPPDPDDPEPLP